MAASKRFIEELYAETALGVTESGESWVRFLASAARNYKLPFHEQLLVFAQRPDATAVLELERWNSLFDRWVNRGACGIAVFPNSGGRRLKYYFDISDTHPGSSAREVPVWSVGDIDGEAAIRALSEEYGLSPDGDLMSAISDACNASAGTDLAPYEAEAGSLAAALRSCARASAAYAVASRVVANPGKMPPEPVGSIVRLFDSVEKVNLLGAATSAVARGPLSTLSRAALATKGNRTLEAEAARGENRDEPKRKEEPDHGNELRKGGHREPAGPRDAVGPLADRGVRADETGIPHEEQAGALRELAHIGTPVEPPLRDPAPSRGVGGEDGPEDSGGGGGIRPSPLYEPDDMGGPDDGGESVGGGDGEKGPHRSLGEVRELGGAGGDSPAPPHYRTTIEVGARVRVGAADYEVDAIEGDSVLLYDPTAPLFPKRMGMGELAEVAEPARSEAAEGQSRRTVPRKSAGRPQASPEGQQELDFLAPTGEKAAKVPPDETLPDTPTGRLRANIAALEAMGRAGDDGRLSPEERAALSRYTGWGGLGQVFDEGSLRWKAERARLRELLGEDGFSAARASVLNAYYTPPEIAEAVCSALRSMGVGEGNVLEPSCGTGAFIGAVEEEIPAARVTGVELDPTTARIAALLHPGSTVLAQGLEDAALADGSFDAVVGNVPFGDYQVADTRYRGRGFLVHDYFFARAVDLVRPGGAIALITSKGTLDKANPSVRRYLAERAELVGAARLPNTAFSGSGASVTTDVIILRKKGEPSVEEPEWIHLGATEDGIPLNQYFADRPEMVLGRMATRRGAHGDETTCEPDGGESAADLLARALSRLDARFEAAPRREEPDGGGPIPADPAVRNYSFAVRGGRAWYRIGAQMYPQELGKTAFARVEGMAKVRDALRALIDAERLGASDEEVSELQSALNAAYDAYTAAHGLISSRANSAAFGQDSSYPLLCALEVLDDDGNLARKADMFSKRTIRPHERPASAEGPEEALALSLSERGRVDLPYMAALTGAAPADLASALRGEIFRVPGTDEWQAADEYLSGNVREKLAAAEEAAASDRSLEANIEALRAAVPPDIPPADIGIRLGATWVPPDDVRAFVFDLLETPFYHRRAITVQYCQATAQWAVSGKGADRYNVRATTTYGTKRMSAYHIIEETLNLRDARVVDYVQEPDGKKRAVLNREETAVAMAKQDAIKEAFREWAFSEPTRRDRLAKRYNELFNAIRPRTFDGSRLEFPGMNPEIRLRRHQKDAVARIVYGGNTLLAHEVGAGKTFEMAAASQELRRIGLCTKSLVVVPNHLTEQWASEYLTLYPAANILVATKRDFEKRNRRRFCARIATGDYDAVIIGHTQLEKIPLTPERQRSFLEEQISDMAEGIAAAKAMTGQRFTVRQMESAKKKLEAKLRKLEGAERKDDTVYFEELGVDRLFVDEAHYYKNLFFSTKMRNVGGVAQAEAQKSSDLFAKCRYLDELTGGKGVVFATGTPVSNSMVELYTMQRYLQYGELRRMGISHFDCWASTFGETVTALELAPEGTGYRQKTRFSKFYNLPELMALFRQVADIRTADTLGLPVPKVSYRNVRVEPSAIQRELVAGLSERADRVRNGSVDPSVDNMLKITNDGRKLALDQRLVDGSLPENPRGKVAACADNVLRIWEETADRRLAQLVFCDLSTPRSDGSFNVYDDLKRRLVSRGIPPEEIAFIHDAPTEVQKAQLFSRVRSGQVRVLMGSTQKMGAGTNVQRLLVALHDLDCPWRPADLQQRLGRIARQGNLNDEVEVYRYVTEGTFDAYLFQLVESKQRFIGQVMTSKSPVRAASDVDETALSYAELKALATGNPLIKERMDLDVEVSRLKLLKAEHLSQRYELEDRLRGELPRREEALARRVEARERDSGTVAAAPGTFEMEVMGTTYTSRAEAGAAIAAALEGREAEGRVSAGSIRGLAIEVSYDAVERARKVALVGRDRYEVALGDDPAGNATRIENAARQIPQRAAEARAALEEVRGQISAARDEAARPFPREDELRRKTARLAELDAELDLDRPDNVVPPDSGQERPVEKKRELAAEAR